MTKYTKQIAQLKSKMDYHHLRYSPTINDANQFQKNVVNMFMEQNYGHVYNNIERHLEYIGKEVYQIQKNFSYTTISEFEKNTELDKILNKLSPDSVIFTYELFDKFLHDYISYTIGYHSLDLLSRKIMVNSTNPLDNLIHLWKLECKQELIEFYNSIIE